MSGSNSLEMPRTCIATSLYITSEGTDFRDADLAYSSDTVSRRNDGLMENDAREPCSLESRQCANLIRLFQGAFMARRRRATA